METHGASASVSGAGGLREGRAGLASGLAALGVSACCILPTGLMLAGLGGSWTVVFGGIAAAGYYVAGASLLVLVLAWVVALRRGAPRRTRYQLALGSALSALAWVVVMNETTLNNALVSLM